ncbi:hypothetical protein K144316041_p20490 (plasmid) [Clostridium tetani]|nr:hypothetical protein K144316041_p20490 [Clostridium tetani]
MAISIIGNSLITSKQCEEFLHKYNPQAPHLALLYKKYCDIYGIRLEVAWVQMCLETNFLRYSSTSITTLDMNNFCGLGALDNNGRREALVFKTQEEGIRCHIQHLYAYCSNSNLPEGEELIDPRFKYVQRGCARNIEDLGNGKWASDKDYSKKLLDLLQRLLNNKIGSDKMTKYAIDCGHTLNGVDYGSKGVLKDESVLTREIGLRVINKLKSLGHTVINCTTDNANSLNDSLSYRVNIANNNNVDLFISIHFNAFNGNAHGTEVFTYGGRELPQARTVLNNIEQLGYKNRCKDFKGNNLPLKDGSNLYVLKNTKMKSMLIECCFCDNKTDMGKYDPEKFANAIVEGIIGKNVSNTSKPSPYVNIDGGGTILNNKSAINLIIRDFSSDIDRIFGYIDNDKKASYAFDINPLNDNYVKLEKNCSKAIYKRNEGYTFSPNTNYKVRVEGYKNGKVVTKNEIILKTLDIEDDKLYRVQVGAFKDKDNADKLRNELKNKGFNGFIKE